VGKAFRPGPVSVRTPATSANLGPGFDALGLALTLYDEVTAEVVDGETTVEVTGEGAGTLPPGEDHLIVQSMRKTFERLGGQPPGIRLRCVNAIPQARGLGSSSAAIVAGVTLAQALTTRETEALTTHETALTTHETALTTHETGAGTTGKAAALDIAGELEGHPDNVAPCILGGFTIAWLDDQHRAKATALTPSKDIEPVVFVPQIQGLTAVARAALPRDVPHRDAAFNAGRSALLVYALTSEPSLLLEATEDRLHQAYRASGMPETAALVRRLRAQGIAAVVSGAGPTVLVLTTGEMSDITPGPGWVRHNLGFDLAGTVVVE
jgi:homoserine kinase